MLTTLLILLLTFGTAYNQITSPSWYKGMLGYFDGVICTDSLLNVYLSTHFYETSQFDYTGIDTTLLANGALLLVKMDQTGKMIWMNTINKYSDSPGFASSAAHIVANNNNLFVGSVAYDTVTLKSGDPEFLVPSGTGFVSSFFAKYNNDGEPEWVKILSSDSIIGISDIALDQFGNIFITGQFMGTADFNPGAGEFTINANETDNFLAKYDYLGNLLWAYALSGEKGVGSIMLEIDKENNLLLCGNLFDKESADFDFGLGEQILDAERGYDLFIAKYNNNGDYLWAFKAGNNSFNVNLKPTDFSIDEENNIICTGSISGPEPVDFDPSAVEFMLTPNYEHTNGFLAKYNPDGNFIFAYLWDPSSKIECNAVATSQTGNIFVFGNLLGSVDLDPSPDEFIIETTGIGIPNDYDFYLMEFDAVGNFIDASQIITGLSNWSAAQKLVLDNADNLIMVGFFQDSIDLDPTPGITTLYTIDTLPPFEYGNGFYIAKYGDAKTIVNSFDSVEGITLYPNPAQSTLNINYQGGAESVAIFDLTGKCLYWNNTPNQASVDVTNFPSGMYCLRLCQLGEWHSLKFIKL